VPLPYGATASVESYNVFDNNSLGILNLTSNISYYGGSTVIPNWSYSIVIDNSSMGTPVALVAVPLIKWNSATGYAYLLNNTRIILKVNGNISIGLIESYVSEDVVVPGETLTIYNNIVATSSSSGYAYLEVYLDGSFAGTYNVNIQPGMDTYLVNLTLPYSLTAGSHTLHLVLTDSNNRIAGIQDLVLRVKDIDINVKAPSQIQPGEPLQVIANITNYLDNMYLVNIRVIVYDENQIPVYEAFANYTTILPHNTITLVRTIDTDNWSEGKYTLEIWAYKWYGSNASVYGPILLSATVGALQSNTSNNTIIITPPPTTTSTPTSTTTTTGKTSSPAPKPSLPEYSQESSKTTSGVFRQPASKSNTVYVILLVIEYILIIIISIKIINIARRR
jgi:hypothetical protein